MPRFFDYGCVLPCSKSRHDRPISHSRDCRSRHESSHRRRAKLLYQSVSSRKRCMGSLPYQSSCLRLSLYPQLIPRVTSGIVRAHHLRRLPCPAPKRVRLATLVRLHCRSKQATTHQCQCMVHPRAMIPPAQKQRKQRMSPIQKRTIFRAAWSRDGQQPGCCS